MYPGQIGEHIPYPQRVPTAKPQRVTAVSEPLAKPQRIVTEPAPVSRTWYRLDRKTKAFLTTKCGRPDWRAVTRRVALDLATWCIIEGLKASNGALDCTFLLLHNMVPKQTKGMCTVLYHTDNKVENMEAPSMEPQRMPSTPSPKGKLVRPTTSQTMSTTQRNRSPRLNTSLDAKRPDVPGNAPHRIVALAAAETVQMLQLTIQ